MTDAERIADIRTRVERSSAIRGSLARGSRTDHEARQDAIHYAHTDIPWLLDALEAKDAENARLTKDAAAFAEQAADWGRIANEQEGRAEKAEAEAARLSIHERIADYCGREEFDFATALVQAEAEAERLRAALEIFGDHTLGCAVAVASRRPEPHTGIADCDCGFSAALETEADDG